MAGSLTFGYMDPIFASVNIPLATTALYILSYGAAAVGMCFGVLLPLLFPGACFGTILSILVGFFVPSFTANIVYVYPVLALLGALAGVK